MQANSLFLRRNQLQEIIQENWQCLAEGAQASSTCEVNHLLSPEKVQSSAQGKGQ